MNNADNCDKIVSAGNICQNCGMKGSGIVKECPNCLEEMDDGFEYCPHCGEPMSGGFFGGGYLGADEEETPQDDGDSWL